MCVPIPPSAGTTSATTQPTGAPIDYSRYAGKSPYDVRTGTPNGLPTNWSWDEWMKVNPGAPDPRNHTSGGDPISQQNLALQNLPRTPVDARNFGPSTPTVGRPVSGAPPPGNTPIAPLGAPPALTTPTTPTVPTSPTTPVAPTTPPVVTDPGPSAAETPLTPTPLTPPATTAAYPVSNVYSGTGLQPDSPLARVSNALARRFKPDGWY